MRYHHMCMIWSVYLAMTMTLSSVANLLDPESSVGVSVLQSLRPSH
jgi:hypothetical protein